MKKFLAALLTLVLALTGAVCAVAEDVKVMTYEEYAAAELDAEVVIECYVQAHQSWWDNKVTVYAADENGAYFLYEMVCSEEDAAKLVPGTKIRVTGYKTEWSGEVEVASGCTFEFVEAEPFIAEAKDLTEVLANAEELIKYQNQLAIFKGLAIEKIEYKNGEPGDDIYVTVKQGENTFDFCVERYLTGPDTEVYAAFADLKAGDVVDITGFVYWYNGVNTHITAVAKAQLNLQQFGPDQVLVEGGGYEKIWLETQPMGGEMYAKHNMTAALTTSCCSCAPSGRTAGCPAPSSACRTAASSPSSTSSRASASPGTH